MDTYEWSKSLNCTAQEPAGWQQWGTITSSCLQYSDNKLQIRAGTFLHWKSFTVESSMISNDLINNEQAVWSRAWETGDGNDLSICKFQAGQRLERYLCCCPAIISGCQAPKNWKSVTRRNSDKLSGLKTTSWTLQSLSLDTYYQPPRIFLTCWPAAWFHSLKPTLALTQETTDL